MGEGVEGHFGVPGQQGLRVMRVVRTGQHERSFRCRVASRTPTSVLFNLRSLSQPIVPSSSLAPPSSSSSMAASILPESGLASHICTVRSVPHERSLRLPIPLDEEDEKVSGERQRDWMMLLCAFGIDWRRERVGRCHKRISASERGEQRDGNQHSRATIKALCLAAPRRATLLTTIPCPCSHNIAPRPIHLHDVNTITMPLQCPNEWLCEHPLHLYCIQRSRVLPRLRKGMLRWIQVARLRGGRT